MKLKFKQQAFQTDAVKAVVDCFAGQPTSRGFKYAIDPGRGEDSGQRAFEDIVGSGFANEKIAIPQSQVLENLQGSAAPAESAHLTGAEEDLGVRHQSRHRDGDRHGQDLLLHQDDVRAEQALWLEQVHRRGAEHRHPRRRAEVVRDHGRALPGAIRQARPLLHLQLQAAAQSGELFLGRRDQRDDHQRAGVQRPRRGCPAHLCGTG